MYEFVLPMNFDLSLISLTLMDIQQEFFDFLMGPFLFRRFDCRADRNVNNILARNLTFLPESGWLQSSIFVNDSVFLPHTVIPTANKTSHTGTLGLSSIFTTLWIEENDWWSSSCMPSNLIHGAPIGNQKSFLLRLWVPLSPNDSICPKFIGRASCLDPASCHSICWLDSCTQVSHWFGIGWW